MMLFYVSKDKNRTTVKDLFFECFNSEHLFATIIYESTRWLRKKFYIDLGFEKVDLMGTLEGLGIFRLVSDL